MSGLFSTYNMIHYDGKDIELGSEDINYTVSFSENNGGDFLTLG
jgi:hypothetical protein